MSGTHYGLPLQIETKRLDGDGQWLVEGYASTYDRDLGDDQVSPGAFTKSLSSGRPVRFLFAHDHRQPIGKTLELKEDERGLFGRFAISKTAFGQDVRTLLQDGALDSFSIGYLPVESERDKKAGVRRLTEVELLEVSVVSLPMNPEALVTSVKAADYSLLPLEDVLDAYSEHRTGALAAVKALCERRLAEGRALSDRVVDLLERLRDASLKDADALLAYLTAPKGAAPAQTTSTPPDDAAPAEAAAPPVVPVAVKTAGLVEAHLRRARLKRLQRTHADVVLPVDDPLSHLERLPVQGDPRLEGTP